MFQHTVIAVVVEDTDTTMSSMSFIICFLQMTHGTGSTWTPAGLGTATKAHSCNGLAPLTGACLSANSHCVTGPAYWAP